MVRILHFLIFVFLIVLLGCSPKIRVNRKHAIVYKVFDSLENSFIEDIQKHAPKKPIGVMIDPKCKGCDQDLENYIHSATLFQIALVYELGWYDHAYDKEFFKKTNRYLSIGGKLYPVFFMWVDEILIDEKKRNFKNGSEEIDVFGTYDFKTVDIGMRKFYPPYWKDTISSPSKGSMLMKGTVDDNKK